MAQPARYFYTVEEYLRMEENSVDKHEYIEGEILLMAGGSPRHNAICANITAELNLALRGKPCTTYTSDMRISTDGKKYYTYADASVVCGEPELVPESSDTVTNPTVLVEVLSPSTENYDRGKKAEYYRRIPSLQSYLLVDQGRVYVEHFRRLENGNWLLETFTQPDQVVRIASPEIEIPLSNIYDKIRFDTES